VSDHLREFLIVTIGGPLALTIGVVLIMGGAMAVGAWYERACRERGICPRCGGDHG
jgi:putative cell wall-binding protein